MLNILHSCKSIAMKFSVWYPDDLSAIRCMHNLPPHLTYISTLFDITQKLKTYAASLSIVWACEGCEKNWFGM